MDAFAGLPEKIEEIQHLTVGEDFKETPKSFDVALSVEFENREALSAFSVHPE
ncbi:MAG TPA: stress responsive protein, partial [Deltaproteobacteria bacterium]|nr:stress responsive protein [Deltaproteobacteria bacterium]